MLAGWGCRTVSDGAAANAVAGRVEVAPRGCLDESQGRVRGTLL